MNVFFPHDIVGQSQGLPWAHNPSVRQASSGGA